MPDGTCQPCPLYEVLSVNMIDCVRPENGAREKLLPSGNFESCPDYQMTK